MELKILNTRLTDVFDNYQMHTGLYFSFAPEA